MKKIELEQRQYVLSISFANYLKGVSGMAKVLLEHQQMYNRNGIGYVNLFVVKKYFFDEKITAFCYYGLVINGKYKGIYQIEQIINLMYGWQKQDKKLIDIHLHHLLFVKMKQIEKLLEHTSIVPIKLYLHDYYTACWNYTLLKNGLQYCGPEKMSDQKCSDCKYYSRSKGRVKKIQVMLKKYKDRIVVIAPSEATKTIWVKFYPEFVNQVVVVCHQKEQGHCTENLEQIEKGKKLRVAFLGMPADHKGWNAWKILVDTYSENGYEFIVFNSSDDSYNKMRKVKLRYTSGNLSAMTEALRANNVHIALLWAKWPETYSYTFYESLSANLYIITNENSGNITDQVTRRGCGLVLHDEVELSNLFGDKERLLNRINNYRRIWRGGPQYLLENDDIVKFSTSENYEKMTIKWCKSVNPLKFPITRFLEKLYLLNKIPG